MSRITIFLTLMCFLISLKISNAYYIQYDILDVLDELNNRHKREASEPPTTESPSDSYQDHTPEGDVTQTEEYVPGEVTHGEQSQNPNPGSDGSYDQQPGHLRHNPLIMSRPGEAPPVFMRQSAPEHFDGYHGYPSGNQGNAEYSEMPRRFPQMQDPPSTTTEETNSGDSSQYHGDGSHGDMPSREVTPDTPIALPMTQGREMPELGNSPIAMQHNHGDGPHGDSPSSEVTPDRPMAIPMTQGREMPERGSAPVAMMQKQGKSL